MSTNHARSGVTSGTHPPGKPLPAQRTRPTDEADRLLEAVHALMHRARAAQRARMPQGGLHPVEARSLGFFVRHPGSTSSDLVQHSGRDKGQVARLIAGLRERGLLTAQPDEQDRRVQRLHPTAAACALHERALVERRAVAGVAVRGLSEAERATLLRLLQQMHDNLGDVAP